MAKRAKATRGSPSQPPPRFSGRVGRRRLIDCLRAQTLVANDIYLANSLERAGELHWFEKGKVIIRQGDYDNDLLLIVHGEVSILINDRPVATRLAGTHVGEMALVDPLATRSATALALKPTVVLRVPQSKFSKIASQHPELWRRVAVEIANRLRARNIFLRQPHNKPVLFIGSSSEGLGIADTVHSITNRREIVPQLWNEGVFEVSSTTIESLVSVTRDADFAVLVLTADDITFSRGSMKPSPRDNIVFELGLLMGALGRERVFVLKPRNIDIRIPTDLLGVTLLEYRKGGPGTLSDKLRAPCRTILNRIAALGPR